MGVLFFVLACLFGLLGPVLVHVAFFASVSHATHVFGRGYLLAWEVAVVYVIAVVVIAVAGGLHARGRRVPPLALHLVALAPFAWAVGGCIVRDRMRIAKLAASSDTEAFVADVVSSEVVLELAATMTAFALVFVAVAAIVRHAARRDGSGTLLVAGVSAAIFAACAARAYGRYVFFDALDDSLNAVGMWAPAFVTMPHAQAVFAGTRIGFVGVSIATLLVGVGVWRRTRVPLGRSVLGVVLVTGALLAVPPALAARDDGVFRAATSAALSIPAGVHLPTSEFFWDHHHEEEPHFVLKSDGERLLAAGDGKLGPMKDADFDRDPLGCAVDARTTYATLRNAIPTSGPLPIWFSLYVEPAAKPEVSAAGALAESVVERKWIVSIRFADREEVNAPYAFVTLGEPLRLWHSSGPELVLPSGSDRASVAVRRAAFEHVTELVDVVFVRVRSTDTVQEIVRIADDMRSRGPFDVRLVLTPSERRHFTGEAARSAAPF